MDQPLAIPSIDQVRAALAPFTMRQLDRLGSLSGVPPTTIYKIKRGETENPGIETVRAIVPHIAAALAPEAVATGPGALDATEAA